MPSGSSATRNASGSTASPHRFSPATSRPTSRSLARPQAGPPDGLARQPPGVRHPARHAPLPGLLSGRPEHRPRGGHRLRGAATRRRPGRAGADGRRGQTRTEHLRQIRQYLDFRKATAGDLSRLESWLVDRALEHDRPTLLLRMACEHLRGLRIERPGVTHLERLIAAARQWVQHETYRRLAPILRGLQGPARRPADRRPRHRSFMPGLAPHPSRRTRHGRSSSPWRSGSSAGDGGSTAGTCPRCRRTA